MTMYAAYSVGPFHPGRIGFGDITADVMSHELAHQLAQLPWHRVLLSKPRLVLMDESTSALDTGNEAALYAALGEAGITYVSVGHRPSLVNTLLLSHCAKHFSKHRCRHFPASLVLVASADIRASQSRLC